MTPLIPSVEEKWIVVSKRKKETTEKRYFVMNVPAFNSVQNPLGFKTEDACRKNYRWWLSQNKIPK